MIFFHIELSTILLMYYLNQGKYDKRQTVNLSRSPCPWNHFGLMKCLFFNMTTQQYLIHFHKSEALIRKKTDNKMTIGKNGWKNTTHKTKGSATRIPPTNRDWNPVGRKMSLKYPFTQWPNVVSDRYNWKYYKRRKKPFKLVCHQPVFLYMILLNLLWMVGCLHICNMRIWEFISTSDYESHLWCIVIIEFSLLFLWCLTLKIGKLLL
jgi:hypothetical protein